MKFITFFRSIIVKSKYYIIIKVNINKTKQRKKKEITNKKRKSYEKKTKLFNQNYKS